MSIRAAAVKFLEDFSRGICNKKKGAPKKMGQYSKRSQVGLYAGTDIRFGNSISFSHKKHRRTWKPNVQKKALWSETLDKWIKFHITTKALRSVDKAGGIDKYLLKMKHEWLNSKEGSRAKKEIEQAIASRPKAKRVVGAPAERAEEVVIDGERASMLAGEGGGSTAP